LSGRVRSEAGFSLPELLVAMSLIAVVMTATFTALDSFGVATRQNFDQNQAQSTARTAVDKLAREVRNAASPGTTNTSIERAGTWDLVFLMVNPLSAGSGSNLNSVQRVRYCLDTSSVLWRQVQTWNSSNVPVISAATACPDSTFGSQASFATYVVNRAGSQTRPVFTYDTSTLASIRSVSVDLYVDKDTTKAPGEQRLNTTLFLRNVNRAPVAGFTGTPTGSSHVLLNASASSDPDGDTLTYTWYDGSTAIGTGAVFDYSAGTTGSHSISVKVTDTGGLSTTSAIQAVTVS
jgi:prepilin-type N-terminal cleavage/methylation domain-containing protein